MKKFMSVILAGLLLAVWSIPASAAPEEPQRVCELPELRETNADTYLMDDGSYECVVYAEDKYYETDSGKLETIDHTLIRDESREGYAWVNAAGNLKSYFSEGKRSASLWNTERTGFRSPSPKPCRPRHSPTRRPNINSKTIT